MFVNVLGEVAAFVCFPTSLFTNSSNASFIARWNNELLSNWSLTTYFM